MSQEDGYSFQSVAIRAKSQGRIRLASSNTHVPPIIDAGYLSDPSDLATLREGIKLGRLLGRRPEWGEYLGEEVYPGPLVQTDEEIDEYIRNSVHTANAMTGTCKMGLNSDCVVGPDLKVFGVNRVRVCDSSIIPILPGGQTATPTVMIADRAAAMIIEDATKSSPPTETKLLQVDDGLDQPNVGSNDIEVIEVVRSTSTFDYEQPEEPKSDVAEAPSLIEEESSSFVSDIVIEESPADMDIDDEISGDAQSDPELFELSEDVTTSGVTNDSAASTNLATTSPSE
jgi:hypothetical protein